MKSTDDLSKKDIDEMTDEERERYIEFLNAGNHLQGAVQAPEYRVPDTQMLYGPPNSPGAPFGMGMFKAMIPAPDTQQNGNWKDETRWTCGCGQENTGKFCTECGMPAPPKPWICPECGTENKGNFCGECGSPRSTE